MTRGVLAVAGAALLALACDSTPFTTGQSPTPERVGEGGALSLPLSGEAGSPDVGGTSSAGTSQAGMSSAGAGGAGSAGASSGLGGDDSSPEGGAPSTVATCPKLPGEALVLAGKFCIDETEVTAAHYLAFAKTNPDPGKQPPECLGNTSFQNGCEFPQPEKQPVRCVDWCDARAYCESVGKHLCGSSAAPAAGATPYDAPAAALENQWYAACSHDGERAYPYGDAYDGAACWGVDRPLVGTAAVKSASACEGGYLGLFDMSGGVAEWVDSCSAAKGLSDACHIRGGSYTATSEQLRCDWQGATARDTSSHYIGFRCCAELAE